MPLRRRNHDDAEEHLEIPEPPPRPRRAIEAPVVGGGHPDPGTGFGIRDCHGYGFRIRDRRALDYGNVLKYKILIRSRIP